MQCPECNKEDIVTIANGGKSNLRCYSCTKKFHTLYARTLRAKQQKKAFEENEDVPDGRKRCSKCYKLRHVSEFAFREDGPCKKQHKLCDRCLTKLYAHKASYAVDFSDVYWRKRAYTCNTVGRCYEAKLRGIPVTSLSLSDLEYQCKPQHLVELCNKQFGKCFFCTVKLTPINTTVDHAQPLSKNGKHHLSNFRLTCTDCNHLKHKRNEQEFPIFLREYAQRILSTELPDKEPVG